jgi:hypothetical protein
MDLAVLKRQTLTKVTEREVLVDDMMVRLLMKLNRTSNKTDPA